MVTIKKVETKKELKQFIRFNYELYKKNPYSVPDLYEDMLNTFTEKNAAMEFCEAVYFLAYNPQGKIVGRVAGIINRKANDKWGKQVVRFGWLDFFDDEEISKALINAVEEWGREKGMKEIEGPLGFTDFDAEGLLIEGFDEVSTMATIYNYPYYQKHIECLGFEKAADWIELLITVPDEVPERLDRIARIVMDKYNLKLVKYKSAKKIKADYGQAMFQCINAAYGQLFGYSELSPEQIDQYVDMYLPVLDLDLLSIITEENGRLIGIGISMPSLSEALQKAKGKLLPFGWWHLLKALKFKHSDTLDLLLVAVLPEYQSKGINSLFFYDLIPIIKQKGFKYIESNPELESNDKVQQQWVYFDRRIHKRRRCFRKEL
ncbi:MAG: N-acetyltransferase [Bacteroidaceae bacterium]|nr:N-acetyltransferase [Bacteroidaceae bacterium]